MYLMTVSIIIGPSLRTQTSSLDTPNTAFTVGSQQPYLPRWTTVPESRDSEPQQYRIPVAPMVDHSPRISRFCSSTVLLSSLMVSSSLLTLALSSTRLVSEVWTAVLRPSRSVAVGLEGVDGGPEIVGVRVRGSGLLPLFLKAFLVIGELCNISLDFQVFENLMDRSVAAEVTLRIAAMRFASQWPVGVSVGGSSLGYCAARVDDGRW